MPLFNASVTESMTARAAVVSPLARSAASASILSVMLVGHTLTSCRIIATRLSLVTYSWKITDSFMVKAPARKTTS